MPGRGRDPNDPALRFSGSVPLRPAPAPDHPAAPLARRRRRLLGVRRPDRGAASSRGRLLSGDGLATGGRRRFVGHRLPVRPPLPPHPPLPAPPRPPPTQPFAAGPRLAVSQPFAASHRLTVSQPFAASHRLTVSQPFAASHRLTGGGRARLTRGG